MTSTTRATCAASAGDHRYRLVTVVLVVAALGYCVVRAVSGDSRVPAETHVGIDDESNLQHQREQLHRPVVEHDQIVAGLEAAKVPADEQAPDQQALPPLDEPVRLNQGLDFDLALYFLHGGGSLDAARIARHIDLNPDAASVNGAQMAALQRIVDGSNGRLRELVEHWRVVRLNEMMCIIDAGGVAPQPLVVPDEKEVRSMAKMLLAASSLQSEGHSLDSVMDAIRREPPPNVGIGEDHVVHRGRAYLTRDFRSLPVSDDMFESMRLFAWESLSSCFAWFLQHGYSPHEAQVESAMQRILLMSTAKLRGVR